MLGFLAVILGTLNVVGGFVVTNRMLEMFRKKKRNNRLSAQYISYGEHGPVEDQLSAWIFEFHCGIKMLSSPDSARKGNLYAIVGMLIAILATIFFS